MDEERRPYDEDDGHTIADMNVEGMPWYDAHRRGGAPRGTSGERMSFRERLTAYGGILSAVGLVTLVFGGAYFLVILLLDLLWS
ncbi:MAG: hypothetical protein E7474_10870 [Ruminococcaceae bacterium]|nr:hypothetical protein [Oscillospiraceae bacterium]